jgi:hypothetical protein
LNWRERRENVEGAFPKSRDNDESRMGFGVFGGEAVLVLGETESEDIIFERGKRFQRILGRQHNGVSGEGRMFLPSSVFRPVE